MISINKRDLPSENNPDTGIFNVPDMYLNLEIEHVLSRLYELSFPCVTI